MPTRQAGNRPQRRPRPKARRGAPGRRTLTGPANIETEYLRSLDVDLLDAEDERRLATQIGAGRTAAELLEQQPAPRNRTELERLVRDGEAARRHMIEANLRLVVGIARRYQTASIPLIDLIQEGNIGLMTAVDKFDPTRGFRFSTMATWWIRQAVVRAVAHHGRSIRLPEPQLALLRRLPAAREKMTVELGRPPSPAELAAELGTTEENVSVLSVVEHDACSLDAPMTDDGAALADVIAADDVIDTAAINAASKPVFASGLAQLDDRQRLVLTLRYGLDGATMMTLQQVADQLGLSRERIRQIEMRALARLRVLHPR